MHAVGSEFVTAAIVAVLSSTILISLATCAQQRCPICTIRKRIGERNRPSEEARDTAAWIDYAEGLGFKKVVLVGHSAGATAVQSYQAETQDTRVGGVVLD